MIGMDGTPTRKSFKNVMEVIGLEILSLDVEVMSPKMDGPKKLDGGCKACTWGYYLPKLAL